MTLEPGDIIRVASDWACMTGGGSLIVRKAGSTMCILTMVKIEEERMLITALGTDDAGPIRMRVLEHSLHVLLEKL